MLKKTDHSMFKLMTGFAPEFLNHIVNATSVSSVWDTWTEFELYVLNVDELFKYGGEGLNLGQKNTLSAKNRCIYKKKVL